ncbi:MAG: hypothetical protein ACQEQ4_00990 [Fibrobacterota bacterium]
MVYHKTLLWFAAAFIIMGACSKDNEGASTRSPASEPGQKTEARQPLDTSFLTPREKRLDSLLRAADSIDQYRIPFNRRSLHTHLNGSQDIAEQAHQNLDLRIQQRRAAAIHEKKGRLQYRSSLLQRKEREKNRDMR